MTRKSLRTWALEHGFTPSFLPNTFEKHNPELRGVRRIRVAGNTIILDHKLDEMTQWKLYLCMNLCKTFVAVDGRLDEAITK